MKYFKYIILLLIAFVVMDRVLYYTLVKTESKLYGEVNYFDILKDYMDDKKFDTLILGTSRTHDAVHPGHIEGNRAFKEADRGRGPMYNYLFYKKYKKMAGVPDVVIYGVDYFIFSLRSDRKMLARFPELDIEDLEQTGLFDNFSLLLSNKEKLDQFTNNCISEMKQRINKGYEDKIRKSIEFDQKYLGIGSDASRLIKKKPRRMEDCRYYGYPGVEGKWFKKLLDEFDKDGVRVMLVIIPDYYGTYMTNCEKRSLIIEMQKMIADYRKISLHNYNMPEVFPIKDDSLFRDGGFGNPNSHLSAKGAEYLYKNLLSKDLMKIYREQKSGNG